MLTKVQLGGILGKKFGKSWNLSVNSPAEALRMIEANKPGLKRWINENSEKYSVYKVICEYNNGVIELLDEQTYKSLRSFKSIKFIPMVAGAGGGGLIQSIIGVALIAASFFAGPVFQPYLLAAGVSMLIGGVVQLLSPRPTVKTGNNSEDESLKSSYFDGPVSTEAQGSPVKLIYGRVLTGPHTISSSISIDEYPFPAPPAPPEPPPEDAPSSDDQPPPGNNDSSSG